MEPSQTLKDQIRDAVAEFEDDQMAMSPRSISVNLQSNTVHVLLKGTCYPAEITCAETCQSLERLQQYHARLFDISRHLLEAKIEGILGRIVEHSTIRLDPVSGDGVIRFTLAEEGST